MALAGVVLTSDVEAQVPQRLAAITVTGTGTAHSVDAAPIPVEVVSRRKIEATTSGDVAKVLSEIPDLYVRQNDEFRLGASTVRMQGADPNKVSILINGRRMRGGVDGVVDLRDIPVESIERIEILRGPASSLYGSDAMAGVINIITKTGADGPATAASFGGGTFGRVFGSASHGGRRGDLDYYLAYHHDELQLAQQFGEISRQFSGSARRAKQQRDDLLVQLDYDAGAAHRLSLMTNYNPVREGPRSGRQNVTNTLGWSWRKSHTTTLDLSTSWYDFRRRNDLPGFAENVTYADLGVDLRVTHALAASIADERHLLSMGQRMRGEQLESRTGEAEKLGSADLAQSVQLASTYLQDEILLNERWSLVVGTSFDVHRLYGAEVNPRAHLTFRPSDSLRLSAGIGRGFRTPDLRQLYIVDANNIVVSANRVSGYVILGNRDLDPETDLGTTFHLETRPLPGLLATLGLFRHDFRDLIDVSILCAGPTLCPPGLAHPFPQLQGPVFRHENVSAAVTQGGDASFSMDPLTWFGIEGTHDLTVGLRYGYLHARNRGDRPGERGMELPFRPPHRFIPSFLYGFRPWGLVGRIAATYEDRTYTDLTNSAGAIAAAHWLLDARLTWTPSRELLLIDRIPLLARATALSVFIESTNVLDTEFGIPTPMGRLAGRRVIFGGVRFEL